MLHTRQVQQEAIPYILNGDNIAAHFAFKFRCVPTILDSLAAKARQTCGVMFHIANQKQKSSWMHGSNEGRCFGVFPKRRCLVGR